MRFGESPSDRSKTSAWLALDKANRLVYLQVWSTGEAEVESGAPNRIDRQEHHNFTNAADLDAVLSDALAYLNDEQLNLDG